MICNPKKNLRWCSTVVVQLIRNQQVVGSIPTISSTKSLYSLFL